MLIFCQSRLQDAEPPSDHCVQESLLLLELIIHQVPHIALLNRPEPTEEAKIDTSSQGPYEYACTVYGIAPKSAKFPTGSFAVPFASSFESLCALTCIFAKRMSGTKTKTSREALGQSMLLMSKLVSRLGSTSTEVAWDPSQWLSTVLDCVGHEACLLPHSIQLQY